MNKNTLNILNQIARRAHLILNEMIHSANHRQDAEKGDPKVGGHPSASTSSLHILGALHLVVKTGFDHLAHKPHTSPTDHAYNYLLDLLLDTDFKSLSPQKAQQAMRGLRAFKKHEEDFVFQSYHSSYDPDQHNFLPSGTVGIPPVVLGYLALAYKASALQKNFKIPEAHFWALIGDSELREGSLMEALPDLAEREIGNLTWIIDYNRQSLDGHRFINEDIMQGSDADRIEKTFFHNGWEVISLQHGTFREKIFQKPGGKAFKDFLENKLKDSSFQALFNAPADKLKAYLSQHSDLKTFLNAVTPEELQTAFKDLGGHDFTAIISAMEKSKTNKKKPCCIIAHTIKGWGLNMAGLSGNHSYLVSQKEMKELRRGIKSSDQFPRFEKNSKEDSFLKTRKEKLYKDILTQNKIKKENKALFKKALKEAEDIKLNIDFQKMSWPHTQWFLGQTLAKCARLAKTDKHQLSTKEQALKKPAEFIYSMSPDVGTSTNLGAVMNEKTFGPACITNKTIQQGLADKKSPDLITKETADHRFLRFEIVEANCISCMTAFGKMRDILGIPLLPFMTIYDFFIKRALDQYFYGLYWNSSFILCGTPSGVTLSPEGAQHGWKSDFQIPGQITWEPFFLQEMEWILSDALVRHFTENNKDRSGVLIRAVTRGLDQKAFLKHLQKQKRFKKDQNVLLAPAGLPLEKAKEEHSISTIAKQEILHHIKQEALAGAYRLVDYRAYADYAEEENVVNIFAMGSPGSGALTASEELLKKGIYANIIIVTSPDLLLGILGDKNNYFHLRKTLGLENTKSPVVSVHDGEAGLLDNIGSILGVRHKSLAVRKHSLSGRPADVYKFQGIDKDSIISACYTVLE